MIEESAVKIGEVVKFGCKREFFSSYVCMWRRGNCEKSVENFLLSGEHGFLVRLLRLSHWLLR